MQDQLAMRFSRCGPRPFCVRPRMVVVLLVVMAGNVTPLALPQALGQYEDSDAGYVDSAFVTNRVRLRFDAGWDLNRPDRAEYFYATWANIVDHPHAIKDTDQLIGSQNDRGPLLLGEKVNFQEISAYFEWAPVDRFSVFAELPIRWVQFIGDGEDPAAFTTPEFRAAYEASNTKPQGVSDLQLGFKYAIVEEPDSRLTFQLRTFMPTGESRSGLGTGHVSVEPALLGQTRVTDNLWLMGQAKLWTPIDGGANAGNITIYGLGLGYNLYDPSEHLRIMAITPLAEFLGWTVLDGFETVSSPTGDPVVPNTAMVFGHPRNIDQSMPPNHQAAGPLPAPTSHGVMISNGETIINAKLGARVHFTERDSIYVGWGRALTGARWYQDFARLEYRRLY